ncbi:inhibitor of Bruton tyrosine kinase [Arctopsyche grandis]|uniref:inhibitor of Bruton tyrosine kinase n=1 Tax=Arctopsyche grandis TaxID=121162 RepID=UPI00406D89D8
MSQSKILPEFDCTRLCNSRQHGSLLTSAVTKRAVSDAALASFFRCSCYNFLHILDYEGRSLLHMVASRGRRLLLEWLIRRHAQSQSGLNIIDSKDTESGYTPFHRSIFYGQIQAAVTLMKAGANISILDNEDMTAIDIALIDRHPQFELSKRMPCEVYTWGANSNYTLGTSSQHHRNFPELLSIFAKQGVHIKQVCLSKFHSAFISTAGSVWTCGHGEGGRLGVATGDTHVLPSSISLPEPCTQAAVGRDHTILLLQSGIILSCGLNDHHQLGQVPPPRSSLSPRPVKLRVSGVRGVYAARYHSVAFNPHVLYTWGLHGGQLGHTKDKEKTILAPKKVSGIGLDDCTIECVAVSDGATVATTSKGDIYLLHQYQCKKIALRQHNIKSIRVIGGEVVGGDQLTEQQKQIMVLMLNSVGNVYLWQDTTNQFTRCIFNTNRPIYVMEVALTIETVMITTKLGEAFHGNIMPKKITFGKTRTSNDDMISPKDKSKHDGSKSSFHQFINRDECVLIKLKRLSNIHRAVDICCDIKGNNFAVLQVAPNSSLLDLPQVTSSQMVDDMAALLDDASEFDLLHDVIFKIKNNLYPAHRYVICHASEYFTKLCNDSQDSDDSKKPTIEIENIHPLIFKQILLFMYTGTCNLMSVGPCCLRIEINADDNQVQIYEENTNELDNLSAFEVYNKKEKTPKSSEKKNKAKDKDKDLINDPVRLLQSAAKKLQVNLLYKILDRYGWQNGRVILRNENYKTNDIKHRFERNKLMDMWDANIKCSDGVIIKAHKCILAARLEYFNGMFAHAWAESSGESTITLPMRHKMLTPIINYLYSDECPELQECEDFEFIGNMLVICDQFFIMRMREMCEVALSNLVTLKNVTEIIQIADTYNCPQLKKCCMEYISLNLSNLLETKSLEGVTGTLLDELSEYYITFNPIMSKRIITPFSESVSDEVVASITESFPTIIEEDCDDDELDEMQKCTLINSGKKKSRTRKTSHCEDKIRKRNESSSSINSLDLSTERNEDVQLCLTEISNAANDSTGNGWTKVVNPNQKQQKIIQARLKAVTSAKEDVSLLESHGESFTKLVKKDSFINDSTQYSPIQSPTQRTHINSPHNTSSPILQSDDASFETLSRSPQTTLNITVVNTKLSQKQRKKLALEYKDNSLLAEQLDRVNGKKSWMNTVSDPEPSPTQPQKNPWQKIQTTRVETPNNSKATFSDILEDQRKQKENLSKMMTKSLALTQLEDKAIEELTRFYLYSNGDEERISVKRVPCHQIAPPQWIHKSFMNSPTRI